MDQVPANTLPLHTTHIDTSDHRSFDVATMIETRVRLHNKSMKTVMVMEKDGRP